MTNYIDTCRQKRLSDDTNKMVAAVHEMGHYIFASTIKSSTIKITANQVILTSESGRWYGWSNIGYAPIAPLTEDSPQFLLEVCKEKISIAFAGKYAEEAMFGANDPNGFRDDLSSIEAAVGYIKINDPTFDIERHTMASIAKVRTFMQENLNMIAQNALHLFDTLNSAILFPKDIITTP